LEYQDGAGRITLRWILGKLIVRVGVGGSGTELYTVVGFDGSNIMNFGFYYQMIG
jgi:hypothetical protein